MRICSLFSQILEEYSGCSLQLNGRKQADITVEAVHSSALAFTFSGQKLTQYKSCADVNETIWHAFCSASSLWRVPARSLTLC